MYKLIFADDEALVRNNVSRLVRWEENGFQLVGCCSNGHELLEMVEKDPPDLVITDINMPFISGLDVARQLRSDFPTVKIIFLTGYDDFNYAKQAIDLNVTKYILKPVSAEELTSCLAEVKKLLDNEHMQSRNLASLKSFYSQNKSVMQNSFINSLLTNEVSDGEAAEKIELLNLDFLAASQFQVAVFMHDGDQNEDWAGESPSLMNFAVWNIAKEILEGRQMGSAVVHDEYVVALLTNAGMAKSKDWRNEVLTVLEEIRATIEKYLKFTITIGVGNVCGRYSTISNSYSEALSALGYRYAIGRNRLIVINDIEPHRQNVLVFSKEKELQLLACIKANNRDGVARMVDDLMEEASHHASMEQMISYTISIIIFIARETQSISSNGEALMYLGDIRKILDMKTVEQLRDMVLELCYGLMESITENRQNYCSEVIEKAKAFINDNYADPNISVGMVSQHLHLSPSYFRAVFKKETGTTFINYLTELRMNKAKELLIDPSMKNYQIAEAVGYSDPQYFSYCFKKYFKVSPNEYRDNLMNSGKP
jgi:two-component system response regulator YesN